MHFHQVSGEKFLQKSIFSSTLFQHVIYSNTAAQRESSNTLNVYLDGDGTPWIDKRWIATDPTPRNPLILELMAMDASPAVLLGRPCYYGLYASAACEPKFWTSHRYSREVVESMQEALSVWLKQHPSVHKVRFIGYSGGGVLAVLLAPYFKQTDYVVTLAANLDIQRWAVLHGYTALTGSLNPIKEKSLVTSIQQLHIAGELDRNVPVDIIQSYVSQKTQSELLVIKGQSHCCWDKQWAWILSQLLW
ncbi:MAG: hypothetical protein GQ582_09625 [Methyloprofundus sp.]|nr:hypothetical protein [Methyloprofundus sp.]